ncbi:MULTISPECIES: aminotransferase class IV [Psychrobacter]|uniref:aminotransferase class IV n=1 Tax=Psychrobacter TaxID=497 RepID=UPI00146D88C6|nr:MULTISPECIES: aminotransferase class IV [Psychrobacter]
MATLIYPNSAPDQITLDNRALAYGDGFFTTMGVITGKILWESYHQSRLINHALALQFDLPIYKFWGKVNDAAKNLGEGIIKLIVHRDAQNVQAVRGYGFSANDQGRACQVWLKVTKASIATDSYWQLSQNIKIPIQPFGEAICLTAQLAQLPKPLAGVKSLNCLDNVMAAGELQALKVNQPQLSEGLVRDLTGNWVEGVMSNMFYQLKNDKRDLNNNYFSGQWLTPPIEHSGVDGVMRRVIIDKSQKMGQPMIIRKLQDEDLPRLSKLLFCNAVRGVMPIDKLWLSQDAAVDLVQF